MGEPALITRRRLNLHEFQSQELMAKYGIKVPPGRVARTPEEAAEIAKELKTEDLILKAQVLAGGRGKGKFNTGFLSGVHLVASPQQAADIAGKMLGHRLITAQTPPEGLPTNLVLVARREYIRREVYFAILLDRERACPVLVGSPQGGMNIEEVARDTPEAIRKIYAPVETMDKGEGLDKRELVEMAKFLGFHGQKRTDDAVFIMERLYKMFVETDCTLCEINPLIETPEGNVICTDAKFNFDPNAEFRQPWIFEKKDPSQADPREVAAARADLNFIGLDGNIGCLVNGAGLAMATMDVIKLAGGRPANFLDVGGGATEKQVTEALRILANDPRVEAILINIFGGIMRCDVIAMGLLNAASSLNLKIPLVVRLQGTNFREARTLLEGAALRIIPADDLSEAASKAVQVAEISRLARQARLNIKFELPV